MDLFSIASIAVIVGSLVFALWKRVDLVPVLIIANLLVFMLTILSPLARFSGLYAVQADLSFRPFYLTNGDNLYTLFTQMFVHGDILHIVFNMLFLYLIGVQLEDRIGKPRFAIVYFAAGVAGVLAQSLVDWGSGTYILGASGAISGAMGAMLFLYPRDQIPFFLGPIFIPRIPVWLSVGSWFGIQVFLAFTDGGAVAYAAHIGGFLAGMAVANIGRAKVVRVGGVEMLVDELDSLAVTPELRQALYQARQADQEDVRRAWLEYFARRAICPRCGSTMRLEGNKIRCQCGYQAGMERK